MGVDAVIEAFARRQHRAVTWRQLEAAGVTRSAVKHRLATGSLTQLHLGVYRVGAVDEPLTSPMAAVLACGPSAVLSHHAAAALHGIRPRHSGPIDVTVTEGHPRTRRGIRVHRARDIERVVVSGIPVTTVTRTLLDIATALSQRDLIRAIDEAQIQRKLDHTTLTEAVRQHTGHRGARALRAAATKTTEPRLTRSEAERRLVELVEAAGLPRPQTNVKLGRWEVDALWEREGIVVEVDGFAYHSTRFAFERDRRKDGDLDDAGYRVLRLTWRQLTDERELVVARLARALSEARGRARPLAVAGPLGSPLRRPRP